MYENHHQSLAALGQRMVNNFTNTVIHLCIFTIIFTRRCEFVSFCLSLLCDFFSFFSPSQSLCRSVKIVIRMFIKLYKKTQKNNNKYYTLLYSTLLPTLYGHLFLHVVILANKCISLVGIPSRAVACHRSYPNSRYFFSICGALLYFNYLYVCI